MKIMHVFWIVSLSLIVAACGSSGGGSNAPQDTSVPTTLIYSLSNSKVTFLGSATGDNSGFSVSNAGDVNADGYDDILIGAPNAAPDGYSASGESYLFYGSDNFDPSYDLSLADVVFKGRPFTGQSGYFVSGAGDVNGDGFDDILIGAPYAQRGDPSFEFGEVYLIYGSNSLDASISLSSADVIFQGENTEDRCGNFVSGAGDVNADGLDDILIGAPFADPNSKNGSGETYLFYGSKSLAGTINVISADATFIGKSTSDLSGVTVSGAGDVDGDGYNDILIGAVGADPDGKTQAGESYLVFGSDSLAGAFDLSNANVTFKGKFEFDSSGGKVASAGDINGDGLSDILIGAGGASPEGKSSAGESYLFYGSDSLSGSISLADASVIFVGEEIEDRSFNVSGAGDYNGDGYDDILIGARYADPENLLSAGETYLVFGASSFPRVFSLEFANIQFTGKEAGDFSGGSISSAGDVNNDGFADILIGAYSAAADMTLEAGESYLMLGQ